MACLVDIFGQLGGLRYHLVSSCGLVEHILLLIATLLRRIDYLQISSFLRGREYSRCSGQMRVICLSVIRINLKRLVVKFIPWLMPVALSDIQLVNTSLLALHPVAIRDIDLSYDPILACLLILSRVHIRCLNVKISF